MTPNEAHDYTLSIVKELQATGIPVIVKMYEPKGNYDELLKKYSGPERATPDKWCRARFKTSTPEQNSAIYEAAKKLGWMGIAFDSGGTSIGRDWELDWSFRYSDEGPNTKHEATQDIVEDLMNNLTAPPMAQDVLDDAVRKMRENKPPQA